MKYEAVIGLEVHVQLKTRSKMFTRAGNRFGEPPNTLTDPVVMGLPGVLPVMNRQAVEMAVQVGLIFGCAIPERCKWDRKHYFYPDQPKNYQISQYDEPLCLGGEVEIELPGPSRNVMGPHRPVRLTRIHLEEDVGKLTHCEGASLVDFNRAGAPLIEIVTEPDMHSGEEAFAFLTSLRMHIVGAGLSDCDMEKGQMRCDANISIRPVGSDELGTKVELKNLNTISGVRNGIDYEIRRQIQEVESGGRIQQETRRWDAGRGLTSAMRGKEMAHDYRYFPDPDLMPVRISEEKKRSLWAALPERPFDRQRRYMETFELPYTLTSVLCPDRALGDYFEAAVAACPDQPRALANWIANDLLRELSASSAEGEGARSIVESPIRSEEIAALQRMVDQGRISRQIAKEVFAVMFATGRGAEAIVREKGLEQTGDEGELEALAREAVAANPRAVQQFREGNAKAINALKGPIMKGTGGKADPAAVDAVLKRLIEAEE